MRRAKLAIKKRGPLKLERRFLQYPLVVRLLELAIRERDHVSGMLYLIAYAFFLRVRSEALGATLGTVSHRRDLPEEAHSSLCLNEEKGELVFVLSKRKNRLHGSRLARHCWCNRMRHALCPIHVFGAWIKTLPPGTAPFGRVSADRALAELRRRLAALRVGRPSEFRLHDFRGGHATDMAEFGRPLNIILQAGEWKSAAFTAYLNFADLEAKVGLPFFCPYGAVLLGIGGSHGRSRRSK